MHCHSRRSNLFISNRILEERSRTKELTLEETKKFDLFIKNLQIIRENNPKVMDVTPIQSNLTSKELAILASQNIKEEKYE